MIFLEIYLSVGLIILAAMTALWVISLVLRDASIVDIFWGTGFVITAWAYFLLTPEGFSARKWPISILVTIWGLRLPAYILWRNWGKCEVFRVKYSSLTTTTDKRRGYGILDGAFAPRG
jgi:steroid 5-alpha reductase family enzyme